MESEDLKQRIRDEPDKENTAAAAAAAADQDNGSKSNKPKREKRMAMAKRGLKSLALMVTVPTLFTLTSIYFSGSSSHSYSRLEKPFRIPPLCALYWTSLASSLLMGLSAWLFWADGGFHKKPRAFYLYVAWLVLNTAWEPIVVGAGASRVGLAVCGAMVGALVGCCWMFRQVNPIAGHLVIPCLALAGLMTIVNFKLAFF